MSTNMPGSIVNFMIVTKHPNPEELTLYAMQFLPPEDAGPLVMHLKACAACREELGAIQSDLGSYAMTVDVHSPPAQVRQRVMKQVAREKRVVPIPAPVPVAVAEQPEVQAPQPDLAAYGRNTSLLSSFEEERPRRLGPASFLGWSGWAIAAGVILAFVMLSRDRDELRATVGVQSAQVARLTAEAASAHEVMNTLTDPAAMRVTLSAKPVPPGPSGRLTYNPSKGSLVFLAARMDPIRLEKVYELWLIPADSTAPIPAGTFRPDGNGNASLILPPLPKGIEAKAFGVTIEEQGGSTTPTKPIIMAGD